MTISPIRNRNIVVAVALDDQTPAIASAACQLSRRTGMGLQFVHVVEPPLLAPTPVMTEVSYTRYYEQIETDRRHRAEKELQKLVAQLRISDIKANWKVLSTGPGGAIATLAAETLASGAAFILCGAGQPNYKFVPQGFSTALSLMASGSVPVLAVKDGCPFNFIGSELRMVIADDLRESGEAALRFAMEWAQIIEGVRVTHVHVNTMTLSNVERLSEQTGCAETFQDLELMQERHLRSRLEERAASFKLMIGKARGSYETMLLRGRIEEELFSAAKEAQANLVVFGRHMAVHWKPFVLGKVSYRAMLEHEFPVMVVPQI